MAVQRKTFGGQFSPSAIWVQRVELRSSGLAANTSTQGAIIASNLKALMCRTHPNPETGSYAAQASLKFMFFLPQSPKSWDYRCTPPQPALPLTLSTLDSHICFPSSTPNAKNNKSITWTNTSLFPDSSQWNYRNHVLRLLGRCETQTTGLTDDEGSVNRVRTVKMPMPAMTCYSYATVSNSLGSKTKSSSAPFPPFFQTLQRNEPCCLTVLHFTCIS